MGKIASRSNYTFRALACEPDTKIFIDDEPARTLGAGEFYEGSSDKNVKIISDRPILVSQYSHGFKDGDSLGDPMMMLISPTEQFINEYRFVTPVKGFWKHFINIIAHRDAMEYIELDGELVEYDIFEQIGDSEYYLGSMGLNFGMHTLKGKFPFGLSVYGFGSDEDAFDAYGNLGGQSFFNLMNK